ncbi:PREDICTED: uncharacterized protein LOC109233093 [Nicotiana attenuata]|uniref:uncharacterized protein LOC109233093 n=1 Tax=Nicotiana attenuata TaxID=49451 RepID=UPI000905738E|nr:PREDICTED: uncharacterized protein LOC109233093 [Nicotiana attenuata]
MKSSLVLQGLWKAIDEDFLEEMKETEKTDLKERALSVIFMSVTDSVLQEIGEETSSAMAWKKLEDMYSKKSLTNRLYLKKRLYNLRMNEGEVCDVSSSYGKNSWVLDFGATFHMRPHKNWFEPYEQMSGTVYIGDDNSLPVEEASVVEGEAVVASGKSVLNQSQLWHLRLGHMSDNGLSLLNKGKVQQKGQAQDQRQVYFLKTKDEAFSTFVKWKTMVERQTKRKVKRLRIDNRLEFCNSVFVNFCSREGIVRHRIFGCPAYAHVRDGKLEPRAKKRIFIGYGTGVKGYRLWCTYQKTPGLIISKDVSFNVSASLDSQREKAIAEIDHEEVEEVRNIDQNDSVDASAQQQPYSIATGREKRVINRPQRFANVVDGNLLGYMNPVGFALSVVETVDTFECYSYSKAIQSTEPNRRISKFRRCLDLVDMCGNG